jgi:hypothetical protein
MYPGQTVDDPEKILTPDLTLESTSNSEFRTHSNPQKSEPDLSKPTHIVMLALL